jgi:hypothetical protein
MVQKYPFAATVNDKIVLVIAFSLASIPIYAIFEGKFHPVILIFPAISLFAVLFYFLKIGKTAIELSEQGIRLHFIVRLGSLLMAKELPSFIGWNDIQGMIIFDYSYGGQQSDIARIIFKKPDKTPTSLDLNSSFFKNSKDLFQNLRKKIPNIMQNHQIFSEFLKDSISPSKIQYKNLTLTEEGIIHPKGIIAWNDLKIIYYGDFLSRISGYGTVSITYQNYENQIESINIAPKGTEQFRNFLRYLISKANKASIDPSLLKIFKSSYRKETAFVKWFVIILIIYLVFFFGYFIYGVFFKYPMPK